MEKVLLGSVAEEVLRQVACPVLTVGPHVTVQLEKASSSEICRSMIDSFAFVLASLLPRNLRIPWHAKNYLANHSVSQRVTATPVDEVKHADDEQHHEEIILADHGILL